MSIMEVSRFILNSLWLPAVLLYSGLNIYSRKVDDKKRLLVSVFTSAILFFFYVPLVILAIGNEFPEKFFSIAIYLFLFLGTTGSLLMLCDNYVLFMNCRRKEKIEKEKTKNKGDLLCP